MTTACDAQAQRIKGCGTPFAEPELAASFSQGSSLTDQDLPSLTNPKSLSTSRGQSFASTTAGSPVSVTTDSAEAASPQTLPSLEEVYDQTQRRYLFTEDVSQTLVSASTLSLSSETLLGPASTFFRMRAPYMLSADALLPSNGSPTTSRFRTPLASSSDALPNTEIASARFATPDLSSAASPATTSARSVRQGEVLLDELPSEDATNNSPRSPGTVISHPLYKSTSVISESRSTTASPLGWTRLRFASCSEEVKERKPSSAADLILKYESAQSGTYKEYRKWKESKWGEDALDEVEFEDDDVNLELSIPAVFSSPIIQLPSVGEAFQNIHERLVGYMISVTDLIINADYYLKHPRDLWQNATSALWMLLPSPPKYIVDSFINVVCESTSPSATGGDDQASQPKPAAQQIIEQSGFGGDPLMEDQDGDVAAVLLGSSPSAAAAVKQSQLPPDQAIVLSVTQFIKWSIQILIFLVSVFVALGVLLMTWLYDFGLWCSKAYSVFDTADLTSCQYIPWVSSAATSPARDSHLVISQTSTDSDMLVYVKDKVE